MSYIGVEGGSVQARDGREEWQELVIEKSDGGKVNSGDVVYFRSHTGYLIDVVGEIVRARWVNKVDSMAFVIEKENGGNIYAGDTVYLKAYTGNYIEIEGNSVRARYTDQGDRPALVIETSDGNAKNETNSKVY